MKRKDDSTVWASHTEAGPFYKVEHTGTYVSELIPSLQRQFKIDVSFDKIHLYNGSLSQELSPEAAISSIAT